MTPQTTEPVEHPLRTLPEGAVLLHIGPYKTGSTSLQAALFQARSGFAEYGVQYPGTWRRAMKPGWSAMGWAPRGRKLPPPQVWERFAAAIRERADLRSCVSTEDFGSVEDRAPDIVADLGGERVHVVTVARRLDRLLPSAWQEQIKSHDERTFSEWLHQVLTEPGSQPYEAFWKSQDIAAQAERWLEAVSPDRFHVIPTDDSDHTLLFRVFERLLGLPEQTLRPTGTTNASLTANSAELMRHLNARFRENGWSDEIYHRVVHRGVIPGMADRPAGAPGHPIPPVPTWAEELVRDRARRCISGLDALGVDVIGDLDTLRPALGGAGNTPEAPEMISIAEAVGGVAGAIDGFLRLSEPPRRRPRARPTGTGADRSDPDLASVDGRTLARELARRVRKRLRSG